MCSSSASKLRCSEKQTLKNEQIQGAGIDVYEKEPPDRDLRLFDLDRATLSAHLGWCSEEAGWTIRYKIFDDIVACINGEKPANTVNEDLDHILEGNYTQVRPNYSPTRGSK